MISAMPDGDPMATRAHLPIAPGVARLSSRSKRASFRGRSARGSRALVGCAAAPIALVSLSGCGLLLDLDPPDPPGIGFDGGRFDGGGRDAGRTDAGSSDAAASDAGGGHCGDGIVQPELGEECDSSSSTCMDCRQVCECPSLMLPCLDRIDCVRGECVPRLRDDGVDCARADGRSGMCASGRCVPAHCGDGILDSDEECDDGNAVSGDGCEPDCVFSCRDGGCDDGNVCNGVEVCATVAGGRACQDGTPPSLDACWVCDSTTGPYLPDADGDGFAADEHQRCPTGFDCDDSDPNVNPGAVDVCNGIDDDCDGSTDEGAGAVSCGPDVDGDGYPGESPTSSMMACGSCPDGSAPLRTDATGRPLLDCWDVADDFGPNVHPFQASYFVDPYCAIGDRGCAHPFDYDCDGVEELELDRTGPRCDLLNWRGCRGDGWVPPVPGCGAHGTFADCQRFALVSCAAHRMDRQQGCH